MSDEQLKDCGVLAISELYARIIDGTLVTVPMGHPNWTKMVPTVQRGERWAFRSMLWIRKDIEAEQVPVQISGPHGSGIATPRPVDTGGVSLR